MAYLNEFPHFEANKLNLDWLLEQYTTFNARLQELHDHFDEAVASMNESIEQFERQMTSEMSTFEREIRHTVTEYSEKVDTINQHTESYVNEYLTENINTILTDNPVLDTRYKLVGSVAPNATITIDTPDSDLIDVMVLSSALKHIRFIANNANYGMVSASGTYEDVEIDGVVHTFETVPTISDQVRVTTGSVFTVDNRTSDTLSVYYKKF